MYKLIEGGGALQCAEPPLAPLNDLRSLMSFRISSEHNNFCESLNLIRMKMHLSFKWFGHRKRHFVVKTVVPRIKWKLNTFVVFRRKWKMKTILLTKECNGTKNKEVNKDDILDEIIQWYQEWRLKWRRHSKGGKR